MGGIKSTFGLMGGGGVGIGLGVGRGVFLGYFFFINCNQSMKHFKYVPSQQYFFFKVIP